MSSPCPTAEEGTEDGGNQEEAGANANEDAEHRRDVESASQAAYLGLAGRLAPGKGRRRGERLEAHGLAVPVGVRGHNPAGQVLRKDSAV